MAHQSNLLRYTVSNRKFKYTRLFMLTLYLGARTFITATLEPPNLENRGVRKVKCVTAKRKDSEALCSLWTRVHADAFQAFRDSLQIDEVVLHSSVHHRPLQNTCVHSLTEG